MEQLFQIEPFKNATKHEVPQMLSDHPNDQHRIDALTKHMNANPSVFKKYTAIGTRRPPSLSRRAPRLSSSGKRHRECLTVVLKSNSKGEKQSWIECW